MSPSGPVPTQIHPPVPLWPYALANIGGVVASGMETGLSQSLNALEKLVTERA